jgi:hypothetical protein
MLLGSARSSSAKTTMWVLFWRIHFGSPPSESKLEQKPVMQQTVEHGTDRGGIAQQFVSVFDRGVPARTRFVRIVSAELCPGDGLWASYVVQ